MNTFTATTTTLIGVLQFAVQLWIYHLRTSGIGYWAGAAIYIGSLCVISILIFIIALRRYAGKLRLRRVSIATLFAAIASNIAFSVYYFFMRGEDLNRMDVGFAVMDLIAGIVMTVVSVGIGYYVVLALKSDADPASDRV